MSTTAALILAAGLIVAALAIGGRYETAAVDGHIVIFDRFTGQGRSCMKFGQCFDLDTR